MWPIFHGPVTLSYISKTIWCMSDIFSDSETVWPKLWPQNKYKSTWPIFHGLVIHTLTLPSICRSVTYILWSSDFASYLEDYLMEKRCTWENGSLRLKDLVKYMWVSDLYFMVHWFYLISLSDLNYFYTLRNGPGRGYTCPSGHLL